MTATNTLRFAPGQFFGEASRYWSSDGFNISHRIADRTPDEVLAHTHQDAHFVLVTGGDYVSAASGGPPQERPVLVYNPPGTTHRDHFEHGRGSFFAISLTPNAAAEALADTSIPTAPLHLALPLQYALVARIARACVQQNIDLSAQALCLELLSSMERRGRPESPAPPAWLWTALEFLNDRFAESLTITDIARSVRIHPIHLARTFRRHFHCTPGEFQRFRRLEKAAGLLARTVRPLAEVALSSGFADQSHLSRGFARLFGVPPGEYRRLVGRRTPRSRMFQIDKTISIRSGKLTAVAIMHDTIARIRK